MTNDAVDTLLTDEVDHVCIRGRRLNLNELVNPRLHEADHLTGLTTRVQAAAPFPHLTVDAWFNPALLELVLEEFESEGAPAFKAVTGRHESTQRAIPGSNMGPASQLYFGIVNSGWFVRILSQLTGVEDLLVDTQLYGGGLHETRPGGRFGVHRDFDRHLRTGLTNEMVLITYLNKDWKPEWGGALELWDKTATQRVAAVEPEFGRTILMCHGQNSFHGHPHPLQPPEGVKRRSLASYYYSNRYAAIDRKARRTSLFMFETNSDLLRRVGKAVTPPVLWDVIAKLSRR
jgi:hypothetical protein